MAVLAAPLPAALTIVLPAMNDRTMPCVEISDNNVVCEVEN